MRRADEQRRGRTHRIERARSVLAQPVIASHRVWVQRAQPFLALAQRRSRGRITISVCGCGAPDAGHLKQVRLREPPSVKRRRPPNSGPLPGSPFGIVQRTADLLVVRRLPSVPQRHPARSDLGGGSGQRDHLRRPARGMAQCLAERVRVLLCAIHPESP
jgi:hypothetical protein